MKTHQLDEEILNVIKWDIFISRLPRKCLCWLVYYFFMIPNIAFIKFYVRKERRKKVMREERMYSSVSQRYQRPERALTPAQMAVSCSVPKNRWNMRLSFFLREWNFFLFFWHFGLSFSLSLFAGLTLLNIQQSTKKAVFIDSKQLNITHSHFQLISTEFRSAATSYVTRPCQRTINVSRESWEAMLIAAHI